MGSIPSKTTYSNLDHKSKTAANEYLKQYSDPKHFQIKCIKISHTNYFYIDCNNFKIYFANTSELFECVKSVIGRDFTFRCDDTNAKEHYISFIYKSN
jgi:hypothetical protein